MVTFICKNVSFGSRVVPRIFWSFVVGSVWLFSLSDRAVSYLAESCVKSVAVVLFMFI